MRISLKVKTNAIKNEIIVLNKVNLQTLNVTMISKPPNNEANICLIKLLALYCNVNKNQVNFIKGLKSNSKTIEII